MYIGIDHSTTGIRSCILDDNGNSRTFTIEQSPDKSHEWSYVQLLSEYIDITEVDMIAYGYSYGDGFSSIKPIENTTNRGIAHPTGLGSGSGGGTLLFDQLQESSLPCVVFPGVNRNIETIHPYFTYHSPMTGADKVAMSRYAEEITDDGENFISACVSSSEIATLILDDALAGAFTWMGLIHGWPASEELYQIKHGEKDVDDIIIQSGFLQRAGLDPGDVNGIPDEHFLEMACCSTAHNVYSLLPFAKMYEETIDSIIISGRLSRVTDPINMEERIRDIVSGVAPVQFCEKHSTARGAAYIARDVHREQADVLGIPVEDSCYRLA